MKIKRWQIMGVVGTVFLAGGWWAVFRHKPASNEPVKIIHARVGDMLIVLQLVYRIP